MEFNIPGNLAYTTDVGSCLLPISQLDIWDDILTELDPDLHSKPLDAIQFAEAQGALMMENFDSTVSKGLFLPRSHGSLQTGLSLQTEFSLQTGWRGSTTTKTRG